MKRVVNIIFVLTIPVYFSSCLYYKNMPREWKSQLSETAKCESFNGKYKLSKDNQSLNDGYEVNDLRYFQNTSFFDHGSKVIPDLSAVNIQVKEDEVVISLFSKGNCVHNTKILKDSFECSNNKLKLRLQGQDAIGPLCFVKYFRSLTISQVDNNVLFVKFKETILGRILYFPIIAGDIHRFKLEKVKIELSSGSKESEIFPFNKTI